LANARASFERALALKPDDPLILANLASALNAEQRYAEALPFAEKAVSLDPASAAALNLLLYARQQICDWRDLEALFETQRASLGRADAPPVAPHNMLALPYTPAELLAGARKWVAREIRVGSGAPAPRPTPVDGKLRIAYLGPDFRTHPLANLLTGVIEEHDRSRFEVFGYSLGPDDGSAARARFAAAFDRFVDVRAESFDATAQRIRNDRIAVLLDTSGFVVHARPEILALRPAPIQINCIGFAGTLGADFYDYILTDRFVSPPGQQVNFVERFMYLPHCYLPGDARRPIGRAPSRADCALPETGFVFCCFNTSYKIAPPVFEVWMRLLRQLPDSVLWLLETSTAAAHNLRREAELRGIAAQRLIFAPRVPLADHLARTPPRPLRRHLPYNAHDRKRCAAGLPS
jgi:predicted O-linked N-acetylglucosamine transferase (SPINDLY family)